MKVNISLPVFNVLIKSAFSCIFILASITCCTAQRVTFNKGTIVNKDYYEIIPYELVNGLMFLTPEINGIKRKFLFDTGAPSQITEELFKELKPEIINHTEITDATGKKSSLNIVLIKEIKLKTLGFNNIPALVSGSDIYNCWHADGVIGSNLIRNSIVQIIPSKHVIILTNDETKLTTKKEKQIPLITGEPQSYPYFVIQLANKKKLKVGFDTGTYNFLRLTENDMRAFKKDNVFKMVSTGYGTNHRSLLGLQDPDSLYRLKISSLSIAGCVFNNINTETNKSSNSRIGAKLLDYGIVTLDFIHHIFSFDPTIENNDISERVWPLKPVIVDNKLIVGVVWKDLKGQVEFGDQILAINDQPCEAMDLCDWLDGKSDNMMGEYTTRLSIRDKKGNIKQISITKE